MMRIILQIVATAALGGLAIYGFLGLLTLAVYWRHRHDSFSAAPVDVHDFPRVTVQLPIFNERHVAERLIHAVAALRYPHDRLQIQVLDDSDDDTTQLAADLVDYYRRQGLDVRLHHRHYRHGYKAGALNAGLEAATGEFIAIFDADFAPQPDFLLRTMPHFLADRQVGLIQARWGHLNAGDSTLTAVQALALDKHFVMEQTTRFHADLFPKFNGTAGVWRRTCLEDAGGWQSDTLCEDLCLSTRAVLRGWRFRYLRDVVAPAELPASLMAYKNQQARWARGSTQCLIKFGPDIASASAQRPMARLYALLTMAAYSTSLLLILLLLAQIPLILLHVSLPSWLALAGVFGASQPLLFVLSQRALYPDWRRRVRDLPALLLIAIGLSATITRAVLQAAAGRRSVFVRTPKRGVKGALSAYRLPFDSVVLAEALLSAYAIAAIAIAVHQDMLGHIPFLLSCALGFGIVAGATLRENLP